MKARNGLYLGFVVGFLGYLIQATSGSEILKPSISAILFEPFAFGAFSGVLFWLGTLALSGRGHADIANAEDEPVKRAQTNEKIIGNDSKET